MGEEGGGASGVSDVAAEPSDWPIVSTCSSGVGGFINRRTGSAEGIWGQFG